MGKGRTCTTVKRMDPLPAHPVRTGLIVVLAGLPACGFKGTGLSAQCPFPTGSVVTYAFPVTVAGAAAFSDLDHLWS